MREFETISSTLMPCIQEIPINMLSPAGLAEKVSLVLNNMRTRRFLLSFMQLLSLFFC